MGTSPQLAERVRSIRLRLWRLLLQAFALVVLFTSVLLIILIVVILVTLSHNSNSLRPMLAASLESYYLAEHSWEGVEQLSEVFEGPGPFDSGDLRWQDVMLLDADGVVVLDHGRADTDLIGQPYRREITSVQFALSVEDQSIGTLVVEQDTQALNPLQISTGLLLWTGFLSFFPAVLTVIIALFLARRVITPLADVMGAAQTVAGGDLSARINARGPDDLRALIESFNQMATALERNDRERRDMLADIAHELRTPLTVIRGRLEGIVEGIYTSDDAHITPVLEEVYLLERLVEDLRLLTLAETRQLHLDLMPVNLADVVQRAGYLFEAEALEKEIDIRFQLDPDVPSVMADPQRVGQVVHNLLGNALRYVPSHGQVTVRTQRKDDGVELIVSDNGSGVPESELPHIFDRFWRYDKSRNRAAGGAGLGLAIARQLIEIQGGSIHATNRPEGGLAVSFILPIAVN